MRRAGPNFLTLIVAVLCLTMAVFPRVNPLVGGAERFQRDVAIASLATYASLRVINAVLSTAQELELGGSLGLTANAQPLKILEPIDDTVERVAAVVFFVTLATGVLSMSMAPVAAIGFFLLGLALLGRCGCDVAVGWTATPAALRRVCGGSGVLGFTFAIGLPLAFVLGVWLGEVLTASEWQAANATLSGVADEARRLIGDTDGAGAGGNWREIRDAYLSAGSTFWDSANDLLQACLTLAGIYLLRLVVLPGLLLVALLALSRRLVGPVS